MTEKPREAVRHEPLVSESLKQNVEKAPQEAQQEEDLPKKEAPLKQHGDALLDGSGTRHGVEDAQTRPNI